MTKGDNLTLRDLLKLGFENKGYWTLDKRQHPCLVSKDKIPNCPGVYLLVVEDTIFYVGKTGDSLQNRVGS